MNYVAYQPAFDVYHTEFRFLRLVLYGPKVEIGVDQLRIADFYLLFFQRLVDVRLAPAHRKIKSIAKRLEKDLYEIQPDDRLLFARMGAIQFAALRLLALAGIIDQARLELGFVLLTGKGIAVAVQDRISEVNGLDKERMQSLDILMTQYSINGLGGLKERTSLMEFKYDAI